MNETKRNLTSQAPMAEDRERLLDGCVKRVDELLGFARELLRRVLERRVDRNDDFLLFVGDLFRRLFDLMLRRREFCFLRSK